MPLVGIVIGSKSDKEAIDHTTKILEELGIDHELKIMSAHRTPQKVMQYAQEAQGRGIEILIGAAGGAAALPGVLAAWTDLPIIGIPLSSSELKGIDSLYSIVQMPPGIPVGCVGVGVWGCRNAAYLVAGILSIKYDKIRETYSAYRKRLRED